MNKKLKALYGIVGFALLFVLAAFAYNALRNNGSDTRIEFANTQNGNSNDREENQKAPDFSMQNWQGENLRLYDIVNEGKPIVINFWASWCSPCIIEMPHFQNVYDELKDEVKFIMLNLTDGMRETRQSGERFITNNGFTFPVYFDLSREAAYFYGIRSIPTTLFLDKEGYVITGAMGAIDEQMLRRGIDFIR